MPNVSIVRATIFISGLNNKVKVKSSYLYYILHSCTRYVGGLLHVRCFDVFIVACVHGWGCFTCILDRSVR